MSYYKTDRGILIEEYDEDVINPREENYSGSCFLTFSRNHSSPDENEYRTMQDFLLAMGAIQADKLYSDGNIADGNDAMMKTLDRKGYISLPVYKYEHSGVCYTAAERNPFNCDWDSCLIGIIYISKTDAKTVFNATRLTKNVKEKVLDLLKAEVKVYSDWADGNCHYYQLMDGDGEEIDSCGGFIGDAEENGIFEAFEIKEHEFVFDELDYDKYNKDIINTLVERAKKLEAEGKIEEIEIELNEDMIAIYNYRPSYEAAFHVENFCRKEAISMEKLRERMDAENFYYVI